jgi:hypothetical protein
MRASLILRRGNQALAVVPVGKPVVTERIRWSGAPEANDNRFPGRRRQGKNHAKVREEKLATSN